VEPARAAVEAMISAPEARRGQAPASAKSRVRRSLVRGIHVPRSRVAESTSVKVASAETASVEVTSEEAATGTRPGADKDATAK